MLRQLFPIALLTVFIASGSETRAQGVAFPEGTGVIDVTAEPWNFDNTGTEDITAKFQQLVDQTIPRKTITSPEGYWPFIIYFPNGVYRITDSIVGAVLNNRAALGGLVIQGESQHGTILRLDDNAAGFGNRNSPKVFLDYFAGNATNNAFINMLENLTLDVGSGNPGAIGLRFHANNTGAVRNVSILSSDPNGAGFAGIEAVKNTNGPWLIRGLEIRGFEYAMNLGNVENNRHMVSIQDLTLFNQSVAGIRLNQFKVNIFNMRSYNNVPLVVDLHPSGMINIIDAEWIVPEGQTTSEAAIRSASPVYLRNIINQGYPAIVSTASDVLLAAIEPGEEWFNRPRNSLWEDSPAQSLQLEILQAPEPEWAPHEDWAIVSPTPSQPNEVAAIRAALASGKSTIVFQPGTYRINDIIRIPPHVQRLAGQWALFRLETGLNGDGRAAFELGPSNHETVVVEKIRGRFDAQANPNPLVLNASHGNLVLRDIFWVSGPILRTEPTRGRVFIENVHSLPGSQNNARNSPAYVLRGQAAWAWQWNPEMLFPHIVVDGGSFFALGWKAGEMRGPIVDVINHGSAEIWGGSMNVTHDTLDINPADTIMLRSVDGNISANFIEHAQLSGGASGWGRHQYVAVESRNGEQRSLLNSDPSITHNTSAPPQFGAVITLFTGFFEQNNPDNQAPVLTSLRANVDATGLNYRFTASGFDPDQFPAGHTRLHWRAVSGPGIVRTANHVGEEVDFTFDVGGDYAIELTATDGALQTSYIFPVRVQPRNYQRTLQRDDVYRYVDNAPQNGVPNLFHPALLQLGDDATNAHSHLRFELDLRSLSGSASRIDSATLQLRVDALNGLSSFTVGYADAQSLGVFASADFSIPRIITGSVSLQGVQVGDWITIDIADAVHFGLENGHDYVSLWLQSDFSNDNNAQFVRFYSTVAQAVTDRPVFSVQLDKPSIVDSAAPVGQGWRFHAVLGHLFPFEDWIFSAHLGWIYTTETIDDSSGFFAYVVDRGWIYSSDRFYPWIFDFDASEWSWLPELGLIP